MMNGKKKYFRKLFLAGVCCISMLSGCVSEKEPSMEEQTDHTEQTEQADQAAENLGDFSMEDIEGETYTQEMFGEYELTMINVFATWCTPCINEIPDLEQLRNDMADQGVNVVGIVLDAMDYSGGTDENAVETAKILAEQTGASYPFLIPDQSLLNGRLAGIEAVPETFFVDQEGNIVGETYSGSRSLEAWKTIVEETLEGAK